MANLRRSLSTSDSSTCSEMAELSQLRRDNQVLQDELTQSKADKEFVWSLWKRLQVANPDITKAISVVLQREKEKADTKERSLTEIIALKDHCIDKLEKATAHQAHVINELLARKTELTNKLDSLGSELCAAQKQLGSTRQQVVDLEKKNAEAACREAVRELDAKNLDLKQQLGAKMDELSDARTKLTDLTLAADDERRKVLCQEEVIKSLESSNASLGHDMSRVKEQLRRSEGKVQNLSTELNSKSNELESARRELSELHITHRNTTNVSTNQSQLIDQLQALHRETQAVLRNQEEAYAMELASLQRTLLEQNEMLVDQREELFRLCETQKQSVAPSCVDDEDDSFERTELIAADARIQVLEAELRLLKENERCADENRRPQKSSVSLRKRVRSQSPSVKFRTSPQRSLSQSPERNAGGISEDNAKRVQNSLNVTEKKLDDLRHLLSLKNDELETLRASHGRRLERLRSLQTSYRLVKQQNRLFQQDLKPDGVVSSLVINNTKRPRPVRPDSKTLQREDADEVWNELSHLRRENKTLTADNMRLVEEADLARIQSSGTNSTLQELRCQLQQQKDDFNSALRKSEHRISCEKESTAAIKKQLEAVRSLHTSQKNEGKLIQADHKNILDEKRDLLMEITSLKERDAEQKLKLCQQRKEILKLQRKLRRKPADGCIVSKPIVSRVIAQRRRSIVEESVDGSALSEDEFDRNDWEDLSSASDNDNEDAPVSDLLMSSESRRANLPDKEFIGVSSKISSRHPLHKANAGKLKRRDFKDPSDDRHTSTQIPESLTHEQLRAIKRYVTTLNKKMTREQRQRNALENICDLASLQRRPDVGFDSSRKTSRSCSSNSNTGSTVAGFVATGNAAIRKTCGVLKRRVETLQTQLTVLKTARDMGVRSCDQFKIDFDSLQEQLQTSNQKLASSKQQIQRLTNELERLRAEKEMLDTRIANQSLDGSSSAASNAEQELLNVQCRLKAATAALSKQLDKTKQLRGDNEKQTEKISKLTDRVDHLERDLTQKRQLVDDYKLKLNLSQENAESDADIMLEVEAKLKSLNEHNSRLKSEVERLKTRVTAITREKYETQMSVRKLSEQLDKKTKLTTDLQKKNAELTSTCAATERSAESHMQQLAARTESAIDTAQSRLLYADGRLGYHAQFVQSLARHILNDIRKTRSTIHHRREEKNKKIKSRSYSRRPRPDVTSSVDDVKQLACDILDLSQSDFNDIMSVTSQDINEEEEEEYRRTEVDAEEKIYDARRDTEWAKKCELLLKSPDDFSQRLVELFVEKMDERCSLSSLLDKD